MNKKYVLKPEHMRKLRNLKNEEVSYLNAAIASWQNGSVKEAKAAAVAADHAHATWLGYFNQLVGWEENGIPTLSHAI